MTNKKMDYFFSGLRIFWRTELRVVVSFLAWIIFWYIMLMLFIMAAACAYEGFYLTHAPHHTPYSMVWIGRGSAVLLVIMGCFFPARYFIRLGKEAEQERAAAEKEAGGLNEDQ